MATLIRVLLILHIASGVISLITGLISMLSSKGRTLHNRNGKIFFWAMTGVFITAVTLGVLKEKWFLFFVGFFSYFLACSGYRALYLKRIEKFTKPGWVDWLIDGTGLLFGAALLGFAVFLTTNGGAGFAIVPAAFGTLCIVFAWADLRRFYKKPALKAHWIVSHGSRMGGAFSAALTAFLVVNVQIGQWNWVLWLAPGLVVGIWSARLIRKFIGGKTRPATS